MQWFIVGGFHPMLHVKLEFMSLAIGLIFDIFMLDDWGGGVSWFM